MLAISHFYNDQISAVSHSLMVKCIAIDKYVGIINIPGEVFIRT